MKKDGFVSDLSFTDKISQFVKVKVTKKEPDAKTLLCGEHVQTDANGNEFFIIPEHQAKYVSDLFPNYTVSKGYLPQQEISKLSEESAKNADVAMVKTEAETEGDTVATPTKKPRGNPHWRRQKADEALQQDIDAQLQGA